MPYLQVDVPAHYSVEVKRNLARRFSELYAEVMQTTPDIVDVTIRELGEGGVWHCGAKGKEPVPAVIISCEIRRGRPPEQRARLGEALLDASVEALGLDPLMVSVEFTQHTGDETYRQLLVNGVPHGGLAKDWSPSETERSMFDSLRAEAAERARK